MLDSILNMSGETFLVFYIVLGVLVGLVARHYLWLPQKILQEGFKKTVNPSSSLAHTGAVSAQNNHSSAAIPAERVTLSEKDLYEVAYLTDAVRGIARAALTKLATHHLLIQDDEKIRSNPDKNSKFDLHLNAVEQRAFSVVNSGRQVGNLTELMKYLQDDAQFVAHCDVYKNKLINAAYIYDAPDSSRRSKIMWVSILCLFIIAWSKIIYAVSRDHNNVVFLTILSFVMPAIAAVIIDAKKHRTERGDHALEVLRVFSDRAAARIKEKQNTNDDVAWSAAVFGFGALAATPALANLVGEKRAQEGSWSSSGSSCGSGSSCSSGCGGGDGGGGGCGGCGGGD